MLKNLKRKMIAMMATIAVFTSMAGPVPVRAEQGPAESTTSQEGRFNTNYSSFLFTADLPEIKGGESTTISHPGFKKDDSYPSGFIGAGVKLKAVPGKNVFHKITIRNISVSTGAYFGIFDKYGINIGDENGGMGELNVSEAGEAYIKLEADSEYTILAYADNSEDITSLSYTRIDVDIINDDVGDSDLDATDVNFNKQYNYRLDGCNDYDYFSFTTKDEPSFYNIAYQNRDIGNTLNFTLFNERNEVVEEFSADKGEAGNKTLVLDKNKKYFFRAHVDNDNPYDASCRGNYLFNITQKHDDYPDINSQAEQLSYNTKYTGGIQHESDKDVIMFNNGDLTKLSMLCTNESTTEDLEYKVQSYDEETILSGTIGAGFIGNVILTSDNFTKNTNYYLVFSGSEGLEYSFTITPVWHKITYELNGGIQNHKNPLTFNETSAVTLYEPTRTGFVFGGWYTTPDFVLPSEDSETGTVPSLASDIGSFTDDVCLYAKWITNGYKIFYNLDGGINHSDNPSSFLPSNSDILLQEPSKVGCTFGGWYTSSDFNDASKVVKIDRGTIGNVTLYAKWIVSSYAVNYKLNGGINNTGNHGFYNASASAIILKNPYRKGYRFGGWYEDAACAGAKISVIDVGTVGDKTFYAKWIKVKPGRPSVSISSKKKKVTIKWKKVKNADGYEVRYSTSKKFRKSKLVRKKATATKAVTSKMKKGKKCYIKIRSHAADSTGVKIYSSWSKVKKIKVK